MLDRTPLYINRSLLKGGLLSRLDKQADTDWDIMVALLL